jgi:hypothetical protein
MRLTQVLRFVPPILLPGFLAFMPARAAGDLFRPLRTDSPPVIDGRLDDPVWRNTPPLAGFKTFIPDFDREPSQKTVAYMAYDAENLYFAFKCYDREPDKIKAAVASRDTIRTDDFICINLDSFNDQQSLYAFYVNPLGIQTDSRFASGKEDFSVDFVWWSAGRIDADGYSVELRVPFKSIRYAGKARVEMSIFFERRISRVSEHSSYPPLDPRRGYFFLTQMMTLELRDIRQYTLLELLPALTHSLKYSRDPATGTLKREEPYPRSVHDVLSQDFSLTGKYGITSQLILDATWNPDFSQVEADAGQVDVNLRYDLFFPEKRPFFLEGSEMFNLAASYADDPFPAVVYTRTIIDPRVGFKLSGKLGKKDTVASILALDEAPSLDPLYAGGDRYAGDAVVRYKRSLAEDSYVGGFYTGREYHGDFNQVAGADGQLRLTPSSMLGFHGFGAWTRTGPEPTAASGFALGLDYLYDTRNLGIGLGFQDISRDFEAALGYLTRNGLARFRAAILPRLYPKSRVFRKLSPQISASVIKDLFSDMYETNNILGLQVLFPGNTIVTVSGVYANEIFLAQRFNTSGWMIQGSSQVTKQLSLRGQFRRGNGIRYVENPYQGYGNRATAAVVYQPSEQFNLTVNLSYADFYRDATSEKDFDDTILRGRLTYQMNKYLFFRGIVEYNSYRKQLVTDFLASFTYIPGTVVQLGYGSLYNKLQLIDGEFREADRFLEMKRGFFFKASYLWRL